MWGVRQVAVTGCVLWTRARPCQGLRYPGLWKWQGPSPGPRNGWFSPCSEDGCWKCVQQQQHQGFQGRMLTVCDGCRGDVSPPPRRLLQDQVTRLLLVCAVYHKHTEFPSCWESTRVHSPPPYGGQSQSHEVSAQWVGLLTATTRPWKLPPCYRPIRALMGKCQH